MESAGFARRAASFLGIAATLLGAAACSGSNDQKIDSIELPATISNGNTAVSCTVDCGDKKDCAEATVFVSACNENDAGKCYEIKPIDQEDGNTYIITLDEGEEQTLVRDADCKSASESTEGLPVDLLFVIDTTGSMGAAIAGVVSSIDSFVNTLAKEKVDVRIGGIAFGDKAPLATCVDPLKPFNAFTKNFGAGTAGDPASFNTWLGGLSSSYCGDGGGDGPENALDAIEFALGNDPDSADAFSADAFKWNSGSLHVMIVITDVEQHQKSDPEMTIAHFDLDEVIKDTTGFAVAHVIGPQLVDCPNTDCACNTMPYYCDAGCDCDPRCPTSTSGCEADVLVGACDNAEETCDIDCPGYMGGGECDLTAGLCDYKTGSTTEECATDYDCSGATGPGMFADRRCEPSRYADMADLAKATRGAFTPFPSDGNIDLNALPLTGVLLGTKQCDVALPDNATAVRCVFKDDQKHEGEVIVDIK